jgi:O-antigen ligase
VLGIGPDNFRLSYGPHVASPRPDARITSNNTYLEILTGTGLIGFAIFAWFLWRAQHAMRAIQRDLTGARASLYDGVVAAAIAIALHGLVDSFLTLTPTYVTMSLVLGLAMAPARWGSRCE